MRPGKIKELFLKKQDDKVLLSIEEHQRLIASDQLLKKIKGIVLDE